MHWGGWGRWRYEEEKEDKGKEPGEFKRRNKVGRGWKWWRKRRNIRGRQER